MGKKKDTGKNFENEIRRSLKSSKHIWWFRIQDTNDINRFVKQAVAEKQPADFFSVYRGRAIMVEAKTSRNLTSFPLYYGSGRAIAKHQIDEGIKLEKRKQNQKKLGNIIAKRKQTIKIWNFVKCHIFYMFV